MSCIWAFAYNNEACNEDGKGLTYPVVNELTVNIGADYIASSVQDDVREKIPKEDRIYVRSSLPLNFKYRFSFTDPHIRHYLPGGYQGVSLGLLNIGALERGGVPQSIENIGYPILAYIFQGGPFYHIRKDLSLEYEWNFGASFGWKPYSQLNKNYSLTVGSKVNAYLGLQMNLVWYTNEYTSIFVGIGMSHFSNGNTSFPNPGVNSMGLRVGVTSVLAGRKRVAKEILRDTVKEKKLAYDVLLWGATRKRVYRGGEAPVLLPGHYACAGISFAPMVRLNTWWRVGGSLDVQWDRSSDMKRNYISGDSTEDIKFSTHSFFRQISAGISAHGELRMPIFAVNIGCGYNILSPSENRGLYQNIALKTYIGEKFFINVGYQLRNFHQQSSLMLGTGLTL